MRKFLRPALIGASSFLLGMLCLFVFFKFSPSSTQSLFGDAVPHSYKSTKPIVPALQLPQKEDEESQAQAQPVPSAGAQGRRPPIPSLFDDDDADFFGGQDPFLAAKKLHDKLNQQMKNGFAGLDLEESGEEITAKEDEKTVSFEIKGVEGSTLNTQVSNGYLTITGESKKEGAGMSITSSFQRIFPLPPNVDSAKMETISEKDKVVLRFPKKHS